MKRQLAHRIHKLLPSALPLLILILIIPLTAHATPYVYTYTDNLFTSTNSGPGNPLEAIGDNVSVQFTCDGDLSALNQTQTFELSPPNIANIVERIPIPALTPYMRGLDAFHFVSGSNGPLPSWSIYGEPDQIGRLAYVNQSIPISKSWAGHTRTPITHHKVQVKRLPSSKLTRVGRPTKAPLRNSGSQP